MPKYVLPELSEDQEKEYEDMAIGVDEKWLRQIRIPANKEIIAALEVGKGVTVTLKGEVTSLRNEERGEQVIAEFEVEVAEVTADASNEYEEMDAAMDEDGE